MPVVSAKLANLVMVVNHDFLTNADQLLLGARLPAIEGGFKTFCGCVIQVWGLGLGLDAVVR